MIEKLLEINFEDIKQGYTFNSASDKYICNICSCEFEKGEIFKVENRYFEAERMIKVHMLREHSDLLQLLMSYDKKFTGITENQKELLSLISAGMTDGEIAKKMGVAPATIRHQRFTFREKAKQAKLYLAIYELAFQSSGKAKEVIDSKETILDIHKGATMVDDRYITTKGEEEQIIETAFSSISPLKLKNFSPKEKKKIVILRRIAEQLEKNKQYSEKELNSILKEIYEDFATIRRYLIEYGFMERTKDCKYYWLKL